VSHPRLWRPGAKSRQQHYRARPAPIRRSFHSSRSATVQLRPSVFFLPIPFHTLHERTPTPASSRPQRTAARESIERDVQRGGSVPRSRRAVRVSGRGLAARLVCGTAARRLPCNGTRQR
jgi:hypothetical protein